MSYRYATPTATPTPYAALTASDTSSSTSTADTELTDEQKEQLAAQKKEDRAGTLATLQLPGSFPEHIQFYFGSQTGTAEKMCNILADEAETLRVEKPEVVDFNKFNEEEFMKQ